MLATLPTSSIARDFTPRNSGIRGGKLLACGLLQAYPPRCFDGYRDRLWKFLPETPGEYRSA
jgi:hypothetical protein